MWRLYIRCCSCGAGTVFYEGTTRTTNPHASTSTLICQSCGSTKFDDPRPGRRVETSAGVWYKPWTWADVTTTWEWNDADAKPMPEES